MLGANSDIGIAIAERYAKSGFNIYLASRDILECQKNASNIHIRYKVQAECLQFDAQKYSSHQNFYYNLKVKPVGVVLAFGVMHEQRLAQENFDLANHMITTNYVGAVSILEIISNDFEKRGSGFIVGISSVAGDRGRMSNYIYGSTKSALSVYLSGLSHRLFQKNVLVVIVKPGYVATKMTKGIKLSPLLTAQPDQVADAVFKCVDKKKNSIYVLPVWWLIMLIIRNLPYKIFQRIHF